MPCHSAVTTSASATEAYLRNRKSSVFNDFRPDPGSIRLPPAPSKARSVCMDATKPYKFIGFGAMEVTKPYKFIGFGAMEVTKPYKFIGFGGHGCHPSRDVRTTTVGATPCQGSATEASGAVGERPSLGSLTPGLVLAFGA